MINKLRYVGGGGAGGATEGVLLFKSVQLYDMQKTAESSEKVDILRGVYGGGGGERIDTTESCVCVPLDVTHKVMILLWSFLLSSSQRGTKR